MSRQVDHDRNRIKNTWAKCINGADVHISGANSGRKGYFCRGCSEEMEAVKFKDPLHASYFRHQPRNMVQGETKCDYSDETFRHQLAKEILQRLKRIKVPAVLKHPPGNEHGAPMFLSKPRWIDATTVRNELYFSENEEGEVNYSKSLPSNAFELVKPDVTFFDKDDQPVLFFELVATHRVSDEKLARLSYLGIDTVEVLLPTGPPEEIENAFLHTSKTKWLFNGEEQRTRYVQPPVRGTADVPSLDELQGGVHGESFNCRKAKIGNLIRAIERCLESEPYRRTENNLAQRISRLARNTATALDALEAIRAAGRERAEITHAKEIRALGEAEERARKRREETSGRHKSLEERYQRKSTELDEEEVELRELEQAVGEDPDEIEIEAREIQDSISEGLSELNSLFSKGKALRRSHSRNTNIEREHLATETRRIEKENERIDKEESGFHQWAREQTMGWVAKHRADAAARKERIRGLELAADHERESLDGRKEALAREFENELERRTREGLDYVGEPGEEFVRGVQAILALRGKVARYEESRKQRKRIEAARKSFASGSFKEWYRP